MARAVRDWQRAGCPGLDDQPDSWQHAGDAALEVLDQLEHRMRHTPPPTSHTRLSIMILELCHDAAEVMTDSAVADAVLQAAAIYVTSRAMEQEEVAELHPRIAINVLKAHLVRLGARALGRA